MYVLQTDHKFASEKDFETLTDWVRDTTEGNLIMICGTPKNQLITSVISCARGDAFMLMDMLCSSIVDILTKEKLKGLPEEIIKEVIPACLLAKLEKKNHADD